MTDPTKFGMVPSLPPVFDHQVTGTFGECERMCYYQHILGRVPDRDSWALTWGTVFHAATEAYHETGSLEAVESVIDQLPDETDDKYGRNRARMYQLMVEWIKFQKLNPIKVLRTEQSVQIKCDGTNSCPYFDTGCDLTYGGRMDRIVDWQGVVGPLDYKTTVMDESDPVAEYRPNHQMAGYIWAASHLMGRHNWGILVERVITNKSKIHIHRYPISYSRDLIREWVQNEKLMQGRLVQLFNHHSHDESQWQQNYFRCSRPYPCAYKDICSAPRDGDFRYKLLAQSTVEKRWDFHNPDDDRTESITSDQTSDAGI
jgi:hypothetical protein